MLSRVGSIAVQQEPFARSGDVAFRSSVPTLLDPLAPNSATTLRLRNYCKIQPTADVLAEVFPIASYKTSIWGLAGVCRGRHPASGDRSSMPGGR